MPEAARLASGMPEVPHLWHHRGVFPTASSPEPHSQRPTDRRERPGERRERRERSSERLSRHAGAGAAPVVEPEIDGPTPADARSVEPVPVRRLLSLTIAGFAGLLGIGLVFGAQTAGVGVAARAPYAAVILGVQALFVLSWTIAIRPPGPRVVAAVGLVTAAATDVAAIFPDRASLSLLAYAAAGGFVAGVIGQLVRKESRVRATESLSATLFVVVGVLSFATLIVLTRITVGTQAIVVSLTSTALSLLVARAMDAIVPYPRLAPQVPRGASGVVTGAMVGSVTGAVLGSLIQGFTPATGALLGFAAAFVAVLADLASGYAEASRELAGEPGSLWLVRHMQGPLVGFALAAPAAYLISVLYLVPNLAVG